MIKKKALACSLVLVVMILAKLYSSSQFNNPVVGIDPVEACSGEDNKDNTAHSGNKERYWVPSVRFANEVVPVQEPDVKDKLETYIKRFSYQKTQSYKMLRKAGEHFPVISPILASYGIPDDFKYMPVIESGLDPKITSHKGAGGYWQFMPATARLYGLKVNENIDERLDLVKSTHAAAKYLKSLYKEFGDWTLVAAAYNVGGGNLKKSIKRQGTDSYYELNLNKETGSYVYKLISVKEVIENPGEYGYTRLAKIDEQINIREPNMM